VVGIFLVDLSQSALARPCGQRFLYRRGLELDGPADLYVPFVIDLATRRVTICGLTTNPNDAWMLQMARNLVDSETGALCDRRHLIVDRDTKYSTGFRQALEQAGIGVIRLPPRSERLCGAICPLDQGRVVSKLIPLGTRCFVARFMSTLSITTGNATIKVWKTG
jgi:hypothetical protein